MFSGTVRHTLDAKYRLRLPAKMRDEIGKFIIVRGINGCLFAFNKKEFDEHYGAKLKQIPTYRAEFHRAKTNIIAVYDEPEEDVQGRFVLTGGLRDFAKITKGIVIVGAIDHIEIWAEERFEQFVNGTLELTDEQRDFNSCMNDIASFNL